MEVLTPNQTILVLSLDIKESSVPSSKMAIINQEQTSVILYPIPSSLQRS